MTPARPPSGKPAPDAERAQMQRIALVLAGAMLAWLAAQWLGPRLGLAGEYAFLIDLAAAAACIWALVLALALWRGRKGAKD